MYCKNVCCSFCHRISNVSANNCNVIFSDAGPWDYRQNGPPIKHFCCRISDENCQWVSHPCSFQWVYSLQVMQEVIEVDDYCHA